MAYRRSSGASNSSRSISAAARIIIFIFTGADTCPRRGLDGPGEGDHRTPPVERREAPTKRGRIRTGKSGFPDVAAPNGGSVAERADRGPRHYSSGVRNAPLSPSVASTIYVAGVVLCNDVSARDVMFGATFLQWFQGKSYRTFCPTGLVRYLLDESEVADTLAHLEALTYKDAVRQSANTSQLIHKPAETLTQVATIMDLRRGDVILRGTPGGVILQGTPKLIEIMKTQLLDDGRRREEMLAEAKRQSVFLQPGDSVTLGLRDLHRNRDLGGQHCRVVTA